VNKYLIFRTDRIGDFLVSAILIKCIKINDPSANITVVGSNKNSIE
jgi:ADP-heptose:LPS heptosyltransferase